MSVLNVYMDLGRVIPPIINKVNDFVVLFDAIYRHRHSSNLGERLQNSEVIDGFPIAIMDFERLPIRWQARRKTQTVRFQLQS